jgi:PAS domain-containing protein
MALQRFRRLHPTLPVVVVAEERFREGFLRLDAFDCVPPVAGAERLEDVLERAARMRRVLDENTQLRAREARLKSIVENLPEGVVLTAADGVVLAANLAALALLGLRTAAEAVGQPLTTFVAVQDAAGLPTPTPGDPPTTLRLEALNTTGRRLVARVAPHQRDETTCVSLIVLREEAIDPATSAASTTESAGVCQEGAEPALASRTAELEGLLQAAGEARTQAEQACERLRQEAAQARDALERERQAWRNADPAEDAHRRLADTVEDAPTEFGDNTDSDAMRWAFEAAGVGVALTTANGEIISCSDAAARLCGHPDPTTFEGNWRLPGALLAAGVPPVASTGRHRFEVCFQTPDGLLRWLLGSVAWRQPAPSSPVALQWLLVDRSEHHRATQRSRFVRHMEGVTSLLTAAAADCKALVGEAAEVPGSDLHLSSGTGAPPLRAALERVQAVLDELARFAQTRARRPVVLSVNAALASLAPMLSWLAGEDTTLDIGCEPDEVRINADPADIGDLLAKMVMAGRDCLPAGGMLTLRVAAPRVDAVDDGVPVHRAEAALTLTARGYACEPITVPGALAQTVARLGGRVVVAEEARHSARLSVLLVPVLGAVTDGPGADSDRSTAADLSSRPRDPQE